LVQWDDLKLCSGKSVIDRFVDFRIGAAQVEPPIPILLANGLAATAVRYRSAPRSGPGVESIFLAFERERLRIVNNFVRTTVDLNKPLQPTTTYGP